MLQIAAVYLALARCAADRHDHGRAGRSTCPRFSRPASAERIPNRSSKSPARKREQKKRWFRNGQKWRTGSEGRISVVKRHHGLTRCRYKGLVGMNRWVGSRHHRRQRHKYRPRYGKADGPIKPRLRSPRCARRPLPADFALPGAIVHNAAEANFAPGSRLVLGSAAPAHQP
jgi:hypothetical protein